jgi:hypothetical protein
MLLEIWMILQRDGHLLRKKLSNDLAVMRKKINEIEKVIAEFKLEK